MLLRTFLFSIFTIAISCLSQQAYGEKEKDIPIVISYLKDSSNSLEFETLINKPEKAFTKLSSTNINLGRDKSVYWFKIDVALPSQYDNDFIFDIDYPLIDFIDYYYQDNTGNWEQISTGSQRAQSKRFLDYRFFAFPVLSEFKSQTIFIRIQSENVLNFNFFVKPTERFFIDLLYEEIYHGIFIGFILLVIVSNIIFYFTTKHKSFHVYVWYMFFTICVNLFMTGHIGQFIFTEIGNWQNQGLNFSFSCGLIFSIWFAFEFLKIKKEEKVTRLLLIPIAVIGIIIVFIIPFADYNLVNSVLSSLTFLGLCIVITIGIRQWRRGHKPAFFYVIAYVSYFIFVTPVILSVFGIIERDFMAKFGLELAALSEAFLLAIALGYDYNNEKNRIEAEKKLVLEENLDLQKQLKSKLEKKVKQRTTELNTALNRLGEQKEEIEKQNKQLEKMNNDKSRFISILAHDVKGPINSLFAFAELLKNHIDYLSKKELVDLGEKLGTHTKNLFSLLENLLQWSRAQSGRMDIKPLNFNIKDTIKQNIELAQMLASNKKIELVYEEVDFIVYADKNMLDTVLRNLIANAIKFSFERSEISIVAYKKENELVLKVIDNGVGMTPEVQEKLFDISTKHSTSGTSGEKGTGLGLKLCKEFVNLNNGRIWVESKYTQGSSFCFTIPLVKDQLKNVDTFVKS